jgi:hypothetical protein
LQLTGEAIVLLIGYVEQLFHSAQHSGVSYTARTSPLLLSKSEIACVKLDLYTSSLTVGSLGKLFDHVGQGCLHCLENAIAENRSVRVTLHENPVRVCDQGMRTRAGQHYISLLALVANLASAMLGKLFFNKDLAFDLKHGSPLPLCKRARAQSS